MSERGKSTTGSGPDDIGRDAGSMGTNPEANAGGSNPRMRSDSVDRDRAIERAGIEPDPDEDYLDTAGSGAAGNPSAMSSTRLNTAGATTEGLGALNDEEVPSASRTPENQSRRDGNHEQAGP